MKLVSRALDGDGANGASTDPSISAYGRCITFTSRRRIYPQVTRMVSTTSSWSTRWRWRPSRSTHSPTTTLRSSRATSKPSHWPGSRWGPPENTMFCTDDPSPEDKQPPSSLEPSTCLKRAGMKAWRLTRFSARTFGFRHPKETTSSSTMMTACSKADIDRVANIRVTQGCNPPATDRCCPDAVVTRGQMAAFNLGSLALR